MENTLEHSTGVHFYPRSPRGERLLAPPVCLGNGVFLSTLPARGATYIIPQNNQHATVFLSTLPARGATRAACGTPCIARRDFYPRSPRGERRLYIPHRSNGRNFYPRSPRGERRKRSKPSCIIAANFYPRSPRGERPKGRDLNFAGLLQFLSTLPARGAT